MKKKNLVAFLGSVALLSCSTIGSTTSSTSKYEYLITAIQTYNDIDANSDGKLTKSEVSGKLLENFTTIDSDNSESLTLIELLSLKDKLGL